MSHQELWDIYVKKNPQFADPDAKITMTARGLKKLFDQTWDKAAEFGRNQRSVSDKLRDMFERRK